MKHTPKKKKKKQNKKQKQTNKQKGKTTYKVCMVKSNHFRLSLLIVQRRWLQQRFQHIRIWKRFLFWHFYTNNGRQEMLGSTFLIHQQQIGSFDSFNQMVHFLGTCRPSPTLSYFAHYRHQISLKSSQLSVPRNGFSPFRRIFQASLQSSKFHPCIFFFLSCFF